MRCCSAHPQPAITLQWRSAYLIYDCVYVFALYGAFNVLFLPRCPATVALWVGTITFSTQTCNPVSKDQRHFWPCVAFYPPSIHDTSVFCEDKFEFWPFYQLFPGSFQVFVQFLKNRSRKCSRMHNSICAAYANRRNLARRDERFCGDNFPVKGARTEPAAASGKYDGTSVCVAYQSEELCTLSPLPCSRHPNL